jgi:hypothetical protein
MPVLAIFRYEGDPDELVAGYDRELAHPLAREQPRRMSHTCARAEHGMVLVDVWESEEDLRKMLDDPEFQKNLEASRAPEPQLVEVYEVHATIP